MDGHFRCLEVQDIVNELDAYIIKDSMSEMRLFPRLHCGQSLIEVAVCGYA